MRQFSLKSAMLAAVSAAGLATQANAQTTPSGDSAAPAAQTTPATVQAKDDPSPQASPVAGQSTPTPSTDDKRPVQDATAPGVVPPTDKTDTVADKAAADRHFYAAHGTSPRDAGGDDVLVTGSRLAGGDPTSRVTIITAEEIKEKGVTSVEDLVRTLPQNLATIGAITNNRTAKGSPLVNQQGRAVVSPVGGLGVAAANLGGVGAGNTLILVNGRRMAAAAGIEDGYVNLNGIPLGAIERVEISTGGEAAIYGADALGGVINFILKSNYVGTTVTAQRLFSSGSADVTRLNAYSGYAWGSGNISGTIEYTRRDPIVNAKTGYVTNNYAPRFGGDSRYDFRSFTSGLQPGVIDKPAVYDPRTGKLLQPETGLTVPTGFTGRPTLNDIITVGLNNARDYVPVYAGPASDTISGTLNAEQKITDRLSIFGTGLITRTKNTQENTSLGGLTLPLAPGQYYNPFPAYAIDRYNPGVAVIYFPGAELADGTITPGRLSNFTTSWSATAGVRYQPFSSTRIEVTYTASSSHTQGSGTVLGNVVGLAPDPTNRNRAICTNYLLQNNLVPAAQLASYQATFNQQCLALTSADPNIAFNPFKSTTNGGGANINNFLYTPYSTIDQLGSVLHDLEARINGRAFKLPAGSIRYAIGGEYAHTSTEYSSVAALSGVSTSPDRYAFFGEATVPFFGSGFTLPLIQRLEMTVALRRDVTTVTGPVGTVNNVPFNRGGQLILATNRFGRTTPSAGLLWTPFAGLDLRAKYTTGFKAPPPTRLFSPAGTYTYTTSISRDPLYTCTVACGFGGSYSVPGIIAPNPDLKPQTSTQWVYSAAWHPTGALRGLNLALTYNRNTIKNEFADLNYLLTLIPQTEAYKIGFIYPRDANGRITAVNILQFNVLGSRYESLTAEASYLLYTGFGSFEPRAILVRNLVAKRTGLIESSTYDTVGTILGPDSYRLNGSLTWNFRKFTTALFVYHTPGYLNDYLASRFGGKVQSPDLITRVSPLTTVDLSVNWALKKNFSVQLAGRNILKANAPFAVVQGLPYDTARYDVAGRTVSLQAQYSF